MRSGASVSQLFALISLPRGARMMRSLSSRRFIDGWPFYVDCFDALPGPVGGQRAAPGFDWCARWDSVGKGGATPCKIATPGPPLPTLRARVGSISPETTLREFRKRIVLKRRHRCGLQRA